MYIYIYIYHWAQLSPSNSHPEKFSKSSRCSKNSNTLPVPTRFLLFL